MKREPELSVIVPAYNVCDYIEKCLDSIVSSTYNNIEVIVVDDGSTDTTGQICDRYSQNDNRVNVLHKENGGLVSARKFGINHAHGDFIAFVDGDDYVGSNLYSLIVDCLDKYDYEPDILVHTLHISYEDKVENELKKRSNELDWISDTEKIDIVDFNTFVNDNYEVKFPNSVVTKVFRTEMLKQSIHYVNDSITKGEDLAFTITCLVKCNSIVFSNEIDGYYYVQRRSSITQTYDYNSIERTATLVKCFCDFGEKEKLSEIWNKIIYNEVYSIIMSDCVGCCFKHYGKMGILSIIQYYRRMCHNKIIRSFYMNGVKNHYFANEYREKYAAQMAAGHYLRALLNRIRKMY